ELCRCFTAARVPRSRSKPWNLLLLLVRHGSVQPLGIFYLYDHVFFLHQFHTFHRIYRKGFSFQEALSAIGTCVIEVSLFFLDESVEAVCQLDCRTDSATGASLIDSAQRAIVVKSDVSGEAHWPYSNSSF